jgi:parallel beta-helix repeat protein
MMKKKYLFPFVCLFLFSNWSFAANFYVATDGDDNAVGSMDSPFLTVGRGVTALSPGDTLYVREGTYAESLNEYDVDIPSGTSWDEPVTITAFPGEEVVLRPSGGSDVVRLMGTEYVVFAGLVMDAENMENTVVKITYTGDDPAGTAHHIRIQDCELMNSPGQGILGSGDYCEFVNLNIHDNGTTDFDHGIYYASTGTLIEGCNIYRNAGWGVHMYSGYDDAASHSGMIVRNNRIHDNAAAGNRGVGILLGAGHGHMAYNNVVWGNQVGIAVKYGGADDISVFNNTIYGNLLGIEIAATNTVIRNNIIFQNGESFSGLESQGTTADHNLDSDPAFLSTDPSSPDFLRPTLGSPVIDAGADLSDLISAVDIEGRPRPAEAWDIGAYEYSEAPARLLPDRFQDRDLQIRLEYLNEREMTLALNLPGPGNVCLQVYDAQGRRVFSSRAEEMAAGRNRMSIPQHTLKNGVYTTVLQWEGKKVHNKVVVVK